MLLLQIIYLEIYCQMKLPCDGTTIYCLQHSLGAKDKNGKIRSMYEPVHGSAPDIAG